jgi:hypothetical protein
VKFTIEIRQRGKKIKEIETKLPEPTTLETLRKIWEVETTLNGLSTDLRWHMNVSEDM